MANRELIHGLVVLAAGLLASSVSSFLEHLAILGAAIHSTRGLFDGLSVVAFCGAICLLVRRRRAA